MHINAFRGLELFVFGKITLTFVVRSERKAHESSLKTRQPPGERLQQILIMPV